MSGVRFWPKQYMRSRSAKLTFNFLSSFTAAPLSPFEVAADADATATSTETIETERANLTIIILKYNDQKMNDEG